MILTPSEQRLADAKAELERVLAQRSGARLARITQAVPLTGDATQETWQLKTEFEGGDFAGVEALVLHSDGAAKGTKHHGPSQEFAVLTTVWRAGVRVPEPLWFCDDSTILGKPFYMTRWVDGVASGQQLVANSRIGGGRELLAESLGEELAKIHGITPPQAELAFLEPPPPSPALHMIRTCRVQLDMLGRPQPGLEWGLRWCELHAPAAREIVLVHQDFRSGHYLVDEHGLAGVIGWGTSEWGDPMTDLGWFCAKCWRYGRPQLDAGGIAPRTPFYRGYERASGRKIDAAAVAFWEVMAHLRRAVTALSASSASTDSDQHSLEPVLSSRLCPPEMELEILHCTVPRNWTAP